MTKEIEKKLPRLNETDGKNPKERKIIVKYFHPFSSYTAYVLEGSKTPEGDWEFFGFVRGFENELGYFTLSELESVKVHGLPIERDMHFGEHMLAEAMEERI
jgi:hypothetical protein